MAILDSALIGTVDEKKYLHDAADYSKSESCPRLKWVLLRKRVEQLVLEKVLADTFSSIDDRQLSPPQNSQAGTR